MPSLKVAQELIDIFYPVGSIYMSMNSTSPATLFGGTWTQISNRFLYCTTSGAKGTGGANSVSYTPSGSVDSHTLTVDEMPSHTHDFTAYYGGSQWAVGYLWGRAAGDSGNQPGCQGGTATKSRGGGQGHSHGFTGTAATINTIPKYMKCYAWYRTA